MSMYDILKKLQNLTSVEESSKLVESKEQKPTNADVMESKFRKFLESEEKAKKDYDGDGEIESKKDEVWGSRLKASEKAKLQKSYSRESVGALDESTDKFEFFLKNNMYSIESIELGKKFCEQYGITDNLDIQTAVELIDSYLEEYKRKNIPLDLNKLKSNVARDFRILYRGNGPAPSFRKKFQGESAEELDKLTKEEFEELDEARRGTFRAGSKSYFKAGQAAIKSIQAAAKKRAEEEKSKVDSDKDPEVTADALRRSEKHKKAAAYAKTKIGVLESKEINFSADDINRLSQIKDLDQLKSEAFKLITTQSKNPMKPEKVEYFKSNLANKTSPMSIIKMMYDLLLSGEGHQVIGSRHSTKHNTYRDRFGENVSEGDGVTEDEYRNPKFEYVDVELSQWKQMVRQQYPDAKIYAAPEEEGGTREAYVGSKFVGDWDGGSEIAGRILKSQDSLNEKSGSVAQQRFFGMVHAAQKGEKPASKEVAKVAKHMGKKDVKDFAKTKHKGLPKHVNESRNYINEANSTFDHLLQRFPAELKQFEKTNILDNDLYDALFDYYRSSGEMPYSVAKARSGDPMNWVADKLKSDLGIGVQQELPIDNELDEIAKLAGLSAGREPVVDENAGPFGGPFQSPKPIGGNSFDDTQYVVVDDTNPMQHEEFAGTWEECESWIKEHEHFYPEKQFEIYPEESGHEEMDEGNEFSSALSAARASGQKEFEVGGKKYTVKEDVNLNISATGEQDALNLIRKLSGLDTQEEPCSCQSGEEDHAIEVIPDTTGISVEELPMEEDRDIEYVNTPREKVAPVNAAYPSGTDLHRTKKSYSDKPYRGDNPMAEQKVEETLWKKYSDLLKGISK